MKANSLRFASALAIMTGASLLALSGMAPAEEVGLAADEYSAVSVNVITKIDKDTRVITLQEEGTDREWQFLAGPEVRNFDQLERGDRVITEYYSGLALALGPKGSGVRERMSSIDIQRAVPGAKPGVKITETVFAIGEVTAVDPGTRTVVLQGAENTLVLAAADTVDFPKIQVGQEVEAAYVQSYAISVVPAPKVSGTVAMKIKSVALGVGAEWGEGTLTMYDGTRHEFKINGISVVDVGISTTEAQGEVFELVQAKDLEGSYFAGQAGAAWDKEGTSVMTMKNDKGVVMKLKSKQQGVKLTLAGQSLVVTLK
ncbi:MAG: hypothetical protein R3286_13235 [Gammaproteobacteria bacterium]|nr:hypothetical protein [Gammaproteobacteria bacterium]